MKRGTACGPLRLRDSIICPAEEIGASFSSLPAFGSPWQINHGIV
jgi:hypothetical protein